MASKNNKRNSQQSKPDKPVRKPRKTTATNKAAEKPAHQNSGPIVVGIGASAGGLKALQDFFSALPSDTGMAFVVITHLHPEHESHLAELLQKHTQMSTKQVVKKTSVQPNHVYVIPPNRRIMMTDSHLDIAEFRQPHGKRIPIDSFFRSLAAGDREAVAIILSGGGTDGAVGIKDIKEQGGLLMVQDPDDAEYDSMPRAAIGTGLVDVVLPAVQLAEKLADYAQNRPKVPQDAEQLSEHELEIVQRILAQVHARTGHDFTQYKRSTILRRIQRRMQLNGFATLEAYLNYLRQNAVEATSMFNDILIGVTNFFRDRESWTALQRKVIPALFEKQPEEDGIRVWSIGCATGEEAYSLAILLFEHAATLEIRPRIQVFASDLDDESIAFAREGLYPAAIEADVSADRLDHFFTREGEYYRMKRELRDAVLFTNHNALRDPPFSRQDLIACRNVLIYLQREVQERVFDIFHYSLNPGGYLFLGNAESAESMPQLFHIADKAHRIYQARPWQGGRPHVPTMPLTARQAPRSPAPFVPSRPHLGHRQEFIQTLEEEHHQALEGDGPPSILIDARYTILHVSETAGRYLLQPRGVPTGDLLKLVRPELQLELRTILYRAFESNRRAVSRPVLVQFNGHPRRVVLSVRPRSESQGRHRQDEKQALILFLEDEIEESSEFGDAEASGPMEQAERDKRVVQVEAEVQRLREQLQVTIEEYDSSNEEMKAANEELQSINEEYRSATEELETSKEELQSLNEELQTVNNELKSKLEEISQAHQELEDLMGATEIATLFLDRDLQIQRFTASIRELFNIMPGDGGRPLRHLTHKLQYRRITEDAEMVLRDLVPLEHEVQAENGKWYLLRLRPFRTKDDRIQGVVITFVDITRRKLAEDELRHAKETLEDRVEERTRELDEANLKIRQTLDQFFTLFHSNPIPTALTRLEDGMFLDINEAYSAFFGVKAEDVRGRTAAELELPLEGNRREELVAQLREHGMLRDLELKVVNASGESRIVLASLQRVEIDRSAAIIASFNDITDRVRAEQQTRSVASKLTAAEQAERHRISRILHDDLQQRIFAVKMQLSFLTEAIEKNELESLKLDISQLDEWLAEAIATTRALSIDLSPPILQGEGLADAIVWLSAQMKDQYGLEVSVESNGIELALDDDVRVLLFQCVRELLFNVVKHSGTLEASVLLERAGDAARLSIRDEGKGFDGTTTTGDPRAAFGLIRMRDRLFLMGCRLAVQSEPGKGTHVTIEAPIKESKELGSTPAD